MLADRLSARRPGGEDGAVAVLVALVLVGLILPLVAIGSSAYVRSTTLTEEQRASDQGSLAGAAEIPVLSLSSLEQTLNQTQPFTSLLLPPATTVNPISDACGDANTNAKESTNVAASFASGESCSAAYLTSPLLAQLQSCLNGVVGLALPSPIYDSINTLTTDVEADLSNPLTAGLGLSGILTLVDTLVLGTASAQSDIVAASLGSLLPELLSPEVATTVSWKVRSPFDGLVGVHSASTQTSTSYAERVFKNVVVVPDITTGPYLSSLGLASATLNVNPTAAQAEQLVTDVLNTLGSASTFSGLGPLSTPLSTCGAALSDLSSLVSQLVSPPASGPSELSIVNSAIADGDSITVVEVSDLLGVPFLDVVQECPPVTTTPLSSIGSLIGPNLTTYVADCSGLPGAFRSELVAGPAGQS